MGVRSDLGLDGWEPWSDPGQALCCDECGAPDARLRSAGHDRPVCDQCARSHGWMGDA